MLLSSGLQLLSLSRKCPTTTVYEPAHNLRIDILTRLQHVDAPADRQSAGLTDGSFEQPVAELLAAGQPASTKVSSVSRGSEPTFGIFLKKGSVPGWQRVRRFIVIGLVPCGVWISLQQGKRSSRAAFD
jgi:hypothetical protein